MVSESPRGHKPCPGSGAACATPHSPQGLDAAGAGFACFDVWPEAAQVRAEKRGRTMPRCLTPTGWICTLMPQNLLP